MKKHKLLLSAIFVLVFHSVSKAQEIPVDIAKRVLDSYYIFEGEVIRSDAYWNQAETYIYTSSTIQISKVLKGGNQNLSCGTVEVITCGGKVGDNELRISHNLVLEKGMKGIFLCNITQKELPIVDYYPEDNAIKLDFDYGNEALIKYFEDGINKTVVDWQFQYDDVQQVYDLFTNQLGLTIVDCGGNRILHTPTRNPLPQLAPAQHTNRASSQHRPFTIIPNTASTNELSYTITHRHITTTSPTMFEFDITLSSNNNSIYFGASHIELVYDTNTFGSYVFSNNLFTDANATGILLNQPYTIDLWDKSYDTLIINTIGFDTMATGQSLVALQSSPAPAIHVSLPIIDCSYISDVEMPDIGAGGIYTGYANVSTGLHFNGVSNYNSVDYSNPVQFPNCSLHIDAITPSKVNGGTGDTVTVEGLNFNSSRGTGNIFLRTSDDDVSYFALDSMDYIFWNDTVIKFIMPGDVYYGPVGSGIVKLWNSVGDTTSGDSLTVWYSINSDYDTINFVKRMYNLGHYQQVDTAGYTFRIDTALSHLLHPDRWNVIDIAIKQWVCRSNVNFNLGDTLTPTDSVSVADNINRIQFGHTTTLTTIAETSQWLKGGLACNKVVVGDVDIIINKNMKNILFWDTDCEDSLPAFTQDAYAVLLHELGHAHSLNHVNDYYNIMYWLDRGANHVVAGGDRNIYLKSDLSCIAGANYVMQQAGLLQCFPDITYIGQRFYTGCNLLPGRISATAICGGHAIGINEVESGMTDFNIYPNPTNDKINVEFSCENTHSGIISVYNMFGNKMIDTKNRFVGGENKFTLDVSKIPTGIYFIRVDSNTGSAYSKFLKQ